MSTMHIQEIPNDVAEKVLRRVEVAKVSAHKVMDQLRFRLALDDDPLKLMDTDGPKTAGSSGSG